MRSGLDWRRLEKDWRWTDCGLEVDFVDEMGTGGGLHEDPWGSVRYRRQATRSEKLLSSRNIWSHEAKPSYQKPSKKRIDLDGGPSSRGESTLGTLTCCVQTMEGIDVKTTLSCSCV